MTSHDVYFGIHVGDGGGHVVAGQPSSRRACITGRGPATASARGTCTTASCCRNQIADARDGIYLSFTDGVVVSGNVDHRLPLRTALDVFAGRADFADNEVTGNLLGAALMKSDRSILARQPDSSSIARGRPPTASCSRTSAIWSPTDNLILANRVGIYAEGVPDGSVREARLEANVIAGNEVGLALQGNAALTVVANRIAENLTDVRALGRQLSSACGGPATAAATRGAQYRGFDADRDGIGDVPHTWTTRWTRSCAATRWCRRFLYTPAHLAIEAAARMFPLFRQRRCSWTSHPLMSFADSRRR